MRLDPEVRRAQILDAVEDLLAEHDVLLVPFEEVARAAGVSRALVHNYFGDRRGLIDAVQIRLVTRLDTWVGHGLGRATSPAGALRALATGLFSFIEADPEAWRVLVVTGGLDHPGLHAARSRWHEALAADDDPLGPEISVAALLAGAGTWVRRGDDPLVVAALLERITR